MADMQLLFWEEEEELASSLAVIAGFMPGISKNMKSCLECVWFSSNLHSPTPPPPNSKKRER